LSLRLGRALTIPAAGVERRGEQSVCFDEEPGNYGIFSEVSQQILSRIEKDLSSKKKVLSSSCLQAG
jgi:hypothetical protein